MSLPRGRNCGMSTRGSELTPSSAEHGEATDDSPRVNTRQGWDEEESMQLEQQEHRIKRRKRRVLSCDECRRLKCRCEIEPDQDSCVRCCSLRLPCSKGSQQSVAFSVGPSQHLPASEIEQRLRNVEHAVAEMRAKAPTSQSEQHRLAFTDTVTEPAPSQLADQMHVNAAGVEAVDCDSYTSPAEVVRKVGSQLNGGYRRTFGVQEDLVSAGLISEKLARDLTALFVQQRRHALLITEEGDLCLRGNLRQSSPFLHAVCCLNGIRASNASQTIHPNMHRQIYERTRRMLGEVMIASPLPLEELTGVLIMAMYASSPSHGPEYIDSWLLSSHCVQQGMLSIKFSEITNRTISGVATSADQRAIRVWSVICLVNLHWAATTARPLMVPTEYMKQSKVLLSFEAATMRDSMLYAEIMLYLALHEKIQSKVYTSFDGRCDDFTAWRERWAHLFDLPTAGILKLSYPIAWLILARRSLEYQRKMQTAYPQDVSATNHSKNLYDELEKAVCRNAIQVLRAFLDLSPTTGDNAPEFHLICVSYATLLLSKYKEIPGEVPESDIYRLLESMDQRCKISETMSASVRFGVERAIRKILARRASQLETAKARGTNIESAQAQQDVGIPVPPTQEESNMSFPENGSMGVLTPVDYRLDGMTFFFSEGHLGLGGSTDIFDEALGT